MAKRDLFHALDHLQRRRILQELTRRPMKYSQLLSEVGSRDNGRGRFNYHLKVLKAEDLIELRGGAYRLTPDGMAAAQLIRQAQQRVPRLPSRNTQVIAVGSLSGIGALVVLLLLSVLLSPVISTQPSTPFPRGWSDLALVSQSENEIYRILPSGYDHGHNGPQVALDADGNALAVWGQHTNFGGRYELWSNRFLSGNGWATPSMVHPDGAGYADRYPRLAVDPEGNGMVMWQSERPVAVQHGGFSSGVWASRFTLEGGWGEPVRLDTSSGRAFSGDIAVDIWGRVTAVWRQVEDDKHSIWANHFAPGSGWDGPILIGAEGGGFDPRLAVDAVGSVVAAWIGVEGDVYANRFEPEDGWGDPIIIGHGSHGPFTPYRVSRAGLSIATGSEGNVVVLWVHSWSLQPYASRFVPGLGWKDPVFIGEANQGRAAVAPQVAIDRNGNALAVWLDIWVPPVEKLTEETILEGALVANGFAPGLGWGGPTTVAANVSGGNLVGWRRTDFSFTMEPGGTAAVVWDDNGTHVLQYLPGEGWRSPALISTGGNQPCFECPPGVVVDERRNVLVLWEQVRYGDGFSIWPFNPGDRPPEFGIVASRFAQPASLEGIVFGLEAELGETQDALETTSSRLADLTGRFLLALGLVVALIAMTGVLFVFYWQPQRAAPMERRKYDDSGRRRQ